LMSQCRFAQASIPPAEWSAICSRPDGTVDQKAEKPDQALSTDPLLYWSIDAQGDTQSDRDEVLDDMRRLLACNIPVLLGYVQFYPASQELGQLAQPGQLPLPSDRQLACGPRTAGHAVLAVGYDDEMEIARLQNGGTSKGALLIRSSFGRLLGEDGYFWLPYDYVRRSYTDRTTQQAIYCARDMWALLNEELATAMGALG